LQRPCLVANTAVVHLRPAGIHDQAALTAALLEAANWNGDDRFSYNQMMATPEIAHYITGWPRAGDFGTVAIGDGPAGSPVGAAWCRLFDPADAGYGYVAADVPELTIGVSPAWRGRGVGTALLSAVIEQARERRLLAISLSVEDGNRARVLYDRAGFTPADRNGGSDTLVLTLCQLKDRRSGHRALS
jgi:ribosomal protein S18 acetylase RimI-like enzyme